jgi:hypothetical protein
MKKKINIFLIIGLSISYGIRISSVLPGVTFEGKLSTIGWFISPILITYLVIDVLKDGKN